MIGSKLRRKEAELSLRTQIISTNNNYYLTRDNISLIIVIKQLLMKSLKNHQ